MRSCAGIDFQFINPGQGFRAEWVRGTVGKLINGCRPLGDQSTTAAMEVAAGGALYQVPSNSEHFSREPGRFRPHTRCRRHGKQFA